MWFSIILRNYLMQPLIKHSFVPKFYFHLLNFWYAVNNRNSRASKEFLDCLIRFCFSFLHLKKCYIDPWNVLSSSHVLIFQWVTESKRRPNEQGKRQAPQSQYLITTAMLLVKGCATTGIYPRILNLRLRPFQILFQRVATKAHHFLLSLRPGVRVRQNCLLTSFSFSLLTVPYRCGIKKKKRYKKENMQRCK